MRRIQLVIVLLLIALCSSRSAAQEGLLEPLDRLERVLVGEIGAFHQGYAQQGIAWSGAQFFTSTGTCNDPTKMETLSSYSANWFGRQTVLSNLSPNRCHVGDIAATSTHVFMPASTFDCSTPFCNKTPVLLRVDQNNSNNAPDVVWDLGSRISSTLGDTGDLAGVELTDTHAYLLEFQPGGTTTPHVFRFDFDGMGIDLNTMVAYEITSVYANGIAIIDNYMYITRGNHAKDVEAYIDVFDIGKLSTTTPLHPFKIYTYDPGISKDQDCVILPGDICPHAEGLTFRHINGGTELWVCAEEGRAVYRLETPDLPPPPPSGNPIVTLTEPIDGTAVSGEIFVTASALDDLDELAAIDFYAGAVLIGSIPNPSNGVPYSVPFDTTPYIGSTVLFSAIATDSDASPNSGSQTVSVTIDPVPVQNSIDLSISPQVLLADGFSFATLEAFVSDASGDPVSGEPVALFAQPGAVGEWVDSFGNPIAGPGELITDVNGQVNAWFRPTAVPRVCSFTASILGDSSSASFQAVGDSGSRTITIEPPRYRRIIAGGAEYSIPVRFIDSLGNPIQNGCAKFTTTLGLWDEGPGSGTAITLSDISTTGYATLDLQVFSEGPGTITVEICESSADCGDAVPDCQGSGSIGQETYSFTFLDPPPVANAFNAPDLYPGIKKSFVSTAAGRMALNSRNEGMTVYDMYTWDIIINWDESDHNDTKTLWKSPATIDLSPNGRYLFACEYGDGVSILDADTGVIRTGWYPREYQSESEWNPSSDRVAVAIEDYAGELDAFGIYSSTANEITVRTVGSSGDTRIDAVAWSAGNGASNQRIAVSYEQNLSTDTGYVEIRSASSFNVIGTYSTPDPDDFNPEAMTWSPDGNHLAVYDDDEQLMYILNRNAQLVAPGPFPTRVSGNVSTIEWSPDGSAIAIHDINGHSRIYDASNGSVIARIRDSSDSNEPGADSLGWRDDSRVIVRADQNMYDCEIYAPLDVDPPQLVVSSPMDGVVTANGQVQILGSVSDDTGLHPMSLQFWIDDGTAQQIPFANKTGEFSLDLNLGLGTHSVAIECRDLAGLTSKETIDIHVVEPALLAIFLGSEELEDGDMIEFGNRVLNGPPLSRSITLQNFGGIPVDLFSISVDSPFEIIGSTPSQIGAYDSESLEISLPTSSVGDFSSNLNIVSSDINASIQLSGSIDPCVCPVDFAPDCVLDVFDVIGFIEAFNAEDSIADFNDDGIFDIFDVLLFVEGFNAGCV